jgi:hypothetical protein
MATYFNTIGKISALDILGVPEVVPRLSRLRVRSTLKFFETEVESVISERRRMMAVCPDNVPDDLLTHLLRALGPTTGDRITQAELRSNILTFIAAGHETTANSLAWALFLLSQSSEWRRRVETEVDRELNEKADGCAERLTETRAVVEEAIRLYPPIAAISRVAVGADDLAGERVRPGTLIVISPYVLHRHRMLWNRPDVFDPRRFLGIDRSKIDRFAYLPFGVGPRICIGSAFALQEATLVLARIVRHFHFDLRKGHAVWPTLKDPASAKWPADEAAKKTGKSLLNRVMANRLDPVAVGIPQERAVIGCVIVAQARRAVVGAAGRNAGVPERVDLGAPLRFETPVTAEGVLGFWAFPDGEIDAIRIRRARPLAIAEPVVAAADLDDIERLHDRVVEPFRGGNVGHGNGDVVEHGSISS